MYFTSSDWAPQSGAGYFDARIFLLDLVSGQAMAKAGTLRTEGLGDPSLVEDDIPDESFVLIDDDRDWTPCEWASNLLLYSGLTNWLLVYMMAKGGRITEEPLPPQQRRLLARKGLPNPWHVVTVEPRFSDSGSPPGGTANRHSFRYDVMGHLRFGNHRLRDGSYRETIEWVRPHQRGLANEMYIPKVSYFRSGKVPDERMRRYFESAESDH